MKDSALTVGSITSYNRSRITLLYLNSSQRGRSHNSFRFNFKRNILELGDFVVSSFEKWHQRLPNFLLRIQDRVGRADEAREGDHIPRDRVGRRSENLNFVRSRSAHDHPLGRDAAHLGRLEVAENDDHPVPHFLDGHELDETRNDRARGSLSKIDLLDVQRIGVRVAVALNNFPCKTTKRGKRKKLSQWKKIVRTPTASLAAF